MKIATRLFVLTLALSAAGFSQSSFADPGPAIPPLHGTSFAGPGPAIPPLHIASFAGPGPAIPPFHGTTSR